MNVEQILNELSLEEKASLLSGRDVWRLKGIERLGVPSIMMTDGPHGLRKQKDESDHLGLNESEPAVCFPTASASACSFDRELLFELGAAIADEARAQGVQVVLGPGINIKRSPLCGRNFEYFSEDPLVSGELGAALIEGLQSRQVGASLKHFALNNQEGRRMTVDVLADERTKREIYLRAFEIAVKKARPWTVMCSYNRIDGVYSSENPWLLNELLRDEWGFEGLTVTDWGACNDHVAGVAAGMDLEMPSTTDLNDRQLVAAVREGRIPMEAVDKAARNVLNLIQKATQPVAERPFSLEGHHHLARKAARDCTVLLKNEGLLPIRGGQKVAFIGEFAEAPRYQGGGSSHINAHRLTGALEAVRSVDSVRYARGYDSLSGAVAPELLGEAESLARESDLCVLFLGLPEAMESEGFDRRHLKLPENQLQLVDRVCAACKQVVAVLHVGAPVELPFLDRLQGLLCAYLGGEAVGGAVVDLLYGAVSPSAKLAESWPLRLEHTPSHLNFPGNGREVRYDEGIYVGYRWYEKRALPTLFPFGHGLSYTQFEYSNLKLDTAKLGQDGRLTVELEVKNTGKVAGKETVQLYVAPDNHALRPLKELRGFEKLELAPGESKKARFVLDKQAFSYWEERIKGFRAPGGVYRILVGASSQDIRLKAEVEMEAPAPLPLKPDLNTPIGEIMAVPELAQKLEPLVTQLTQALAPPDDGPGIIPAGALQEMLADMPLRSIKAFAGHMLAEGQLEELVESMRKPD